jgi:hypothetical protein
MFTTITKSYPIDPIEISVKHDTTEAEDSEKVNVYQMDLATNTKVYDPKLSGAGEIESTINHPTTATLDASVLDDTTTVKTLTKDKSQLKWNGKWDNGTNNNKIADPKKYSISVNLYKDSAKTTLIDSETKDIYVVRLGIEKIEFATNSTGGTYVPMQFHTTQNDINTGIASGKWAYTASWQLSNDETNLNVDKKDGSAAYAQDDIYTETFYPKMKTSTSTSPSTVRSEHFNYPICYVKGSKIKLKLKPSNNYVSHLTAAATTGTIPTGTPGIYLKVKRNTIEKTSTSAITATTDVEIELDSVVKDSVGDETLEFTYSWFYNDGGDVTIPGSFTSKHKCYTIVDTPHSPWGIGTGEKPWVAMIDLATTWAKDATDGDAVADAITTKINGGLGLEYDKDGMPNYANGGVTRQANFLFFIRTGEAVYAARYNGAEPSKNVNCDDCGSLLVSFSNVIGADITLTKIDDKHALNELLPIGQPVQLPFHGSFRYHAFSSREDKIWDACLQVGRPDPIYDSTQWELPKGMKHIVSEPAWATDGVNDTKNGNTLTISMGQSKGELKISKVWQESNHHGNILTKSGVHKYTVICTKLKTALAPSEFTLTCTRITGFTSIVIQANDVVKTCSHKGCNLLDISIKEGDTPFAIGDKFEFRTEYDFNEYRSSLAAPDWFLPNVKGRTPASTLKTETLTLE